MRLYNRKSVKVSLNFIQRCRRSCELEHLVDGIKLGNASAVLAASIFHYGKYSIKEAKEYLDSKGIPVRI